MPAEKLFVRTDSIELIPAEPRHGEHFPQLTYDTDPPLWDYFVGKDMALLDKWMRPMWAAERGLFSHVHCTVAVQDNVVLGIEMGFGPQTQGEHFPDTVQLSQKVLKPNELAEVMNAMQYSAYITPHIPQDAYYLMLLSVAPEGRSKGVGARLLENAFDVAKEDGFKSVHLDVYAGNPALKFYERHGMDRLVEVRIPFLDEQHGVPAHYRMVKTF